jgi:hypothetical protein
VERKSVTISFSKKKEKQYHEVAKSAGHKIFPITISANENNPSKAQQLTSIRRVEV